MVVQSLTKSKKGSFGVANDIFSRRRRDPAVCGLQDLEKLCGIKKNSLRSDNRAQSYVVLKFGRVQCFTVLLSRGEAITVLLSHGEAVTVLLSRGEAITALL
ncbi:unnamed protein product [Linum trigynum]|uniref:Uncharacterized protein n=1 Tax=Linum trigynum TaxID=586398 RepID=A0AAV2CXZ2_9ROSI